MFILILTVFAVMLNDGTIIKKDVPTTAVIESYNTLKACEDDRRGVTAMMLMNDREGESATYALACKEAKKPQERGA